jgi:hypothetical protein
MAPKHDHFLADVARNNHNRRVSYWDGFRFGLGFITANLLVLVVLSGLTWLLAWALHLT